MKKIIRFWFIHLIALEIISQATAAVEFGSGFIGLALSALVLAIFSLFLKPILKLLLLPINLLTLGLLRWVINIFGLFLTNYLVPSFKIIPFIFAGYSTPKITISPFNLSLLGTYLLISFFLDFSLIIINWILKK